MERLCACFLSLLFLAISNRLFRKTNFGTRNPTTALGLGFPPSRTRTTDTLSLGQHLFTVEKPTTSHEASRQLHRSWACILHLVTTLAAPPPTPLTPPSIPRRKPLCSTKCHNHDLSRTTWTSTFRQAEEEMVRRIWRSIRPSPSF